MGFFLRSLKHRFHRNRRGRGRKNSKGTSFGGIHRRAARHPPCGIDCDQSVQHAEIEEEAERPDDLHQPTRCQRAGDRAEAVDEQQPRRGRGHIRAIKEVVGIGHKQGIDRIGNPAAHCCHDDQHHEMRLQQRDHQHQHPTHGSEDQDQQATIHPVRHPADRILAHQPADIDRRDEDRDLRHGQPRHTAPDRGHPEQRREHAPHQEHADTAQRRGAEQLLERHPLGCRKDRRGRSGKQDRREGERDQNRRDHEEQIPARIADIQQDLRRDNPHHLHDHIGRQRLATGFIGGGGVQPAFRRDIDARETEADHHPHHRPSDPIRGGGIEDQHRRDQRSEGREHPHMADFADHLRRQARAEQEADKIRRHDNRHMIGAEPLDIPADPEERPLNPVADHQQHDAQQKGP